MECAEYREDLHELQRGRLDAARATALRQHLASCEGCARADAVERALTELLEARLPRHAAPEALKRRLATLAAPAGEAGHGAAFAPGRPAGRRLAHSIARWAAPALAAGLAATTTVLLVGHRAGRVDPAQALAVEAVNDHLRVLVREHPVDVESGNTHQVKPWFEGKLDFAPSVPQPPELRLVGGSVGYFFDRKAAVLLYALHRHLVTLLCFPAEGLDWPGPTGRLHAVSLRGFHVLLWRSGELGYALVSDAEARELETIASQLAPGS